MPHNGIETAALLARATKGDATARSELLDRHRPRLLRMVQVRLDPRLRQRLDPDDVVQEVLTEADARLPEYGGDGAMPFFLWLRFLTAQRIAAEARQHLGAQARDARREIRIHDATLSHGSGLLADRLSAHVTSPSAAAARGEVRTRMAEAFERMSEADREILLLRHFEQLTSVEAARELGIDRSAASKRYVRALARLRAVLVEMGFVE